MENIYYVYSHQCPVTGEVVYYGMGSKGRAWVCHGTLSRKDDHEAWMDNLLSEGYTPADWVSIIAQGLSRESATKLEQSLYKAEWPKFNRNMSEILRTMSEEQVYEMCLLRETGLSYKLIAERVGTSTMTAYRWINKENQ